MLHAKRCFKFYLFIFSHNIYNLINICLCFNISTLLNYHWHFHPVYITNCVQQLVIKTFSKWNCDLKITNNCRQTHRTITQIFHHYSNCRNNSHFVLILTNMCTFILRHPSINICSISFTYIHSYNEYVSI